MMELIIELNKMCNRFEGYTTKAIRDTVMEEEDANVKKVICTVVKNINDVVAFFDDLFEGVTYPEMDTLYINKYLELINVYYFICKKTSFLPMYSKHYWQETNKQILNLWKESSFEEKDKNDLFIKIFDDLLGNMLSANPEVCDRKLSDFKNMYRATTYMVNDAYSFIMPDPDYCKDNRWNDDGVAFLYLAYDNEDMNYQNITLAEKTCFEECRLVDGTEVAVCQFEPVNDSAKILYLAYQDVDYDDLLADLNREIVTRTDEVIQLLGEKKKVRSKLQQYATNQRKDLFMKEVRKILNKAGINDEMKAQVQNVLFITMLGNICDSVFYAVDKEKDPKLEAYIPFRKFSKYLIHLGYRGVAYRSTRMELIGLNGTNLVVFEPSDARPKKGTMNVYKYHDKEECERINQY